MLKTYRDCTETSPYFPVILDPRGWNKLCLRLATETMHITGKNKVRQCSVNSLHFTWSRDRMPSLRQSLCIYASTAVNLQYVVGAFKTCRSTLTCALHQEGFPVASRWKEANYCKRSDLSFEIEVFIQPWNLTTVKKSQIGYNVDFTLNYSGD